jgi:hypothetical protein
MAGNLFVFRDEKTLVELTPEAYESEELLQRLLARFPNLLSGGDIDPEAPRRWILVAREAGVPGEEAGGDRWYVDHLLLDQDGIPTLVEVKRSSDTRIRREVVGQMLDYAANATAHWPVERLLAAFEEQCRRDGRDAGEVIAELLGPGGDPNVFWQKVKTNLQAGKLRLILVADLIPRELARVVEFLNEQMDPAEVLAVEIRQYVGQGLRSLVPRVIGQTEKAEQRKVGSSRGGRVWTRESFFERLAERQGGVAAACVGRVVDWATGAGARLAFGQGMVDGSLYPVWDAGQQWYCPVVFYTYGAVEVQFQYLKERAPFRDEEVLREYFRRLNQIPRVQLPESRLSGRPSFRVELLQDPRAEAAFVEVLQWFLEQLPR